MSFSILVVDANPILRICSGEALGTVVCCRKSDGCGGRCRSWWRPLAAMRAGAAAFLAKPVDFNALKKVADAGRLEE
jgi:hypothetical protein